MEKNYKVKVLRNFNDLQEDIQRSKGNVFLCTKERYEYLKNHNAVELIEVVVNEIAEVNEPVRNVEEVTPKKEYKKPRRK